MKKTLLTICAFLATVGVVNAKQLWEYASFTERAQKAVELNLVASPSEYTGDLATNSVLLSYYQNGEQVTESVEMLGAGTLPIAGATFNLAGSGISSSATSITLQSLTITQTGQGIVDSDLSDTFYLTLEPGNRSRQEVVSCTTVVQNANGTATLSGCSRGLSPISPYTASTTLAFSHAGGTQVIFSDPPQLFNEYGAKANDETITGKWTWSVHPEANSSIGTPTTTYQYVTKQYADNIANQGAATSTESNAGIAELATQIEMASTTDNGVNDPLVLQAKYASSTPTAESPVLRSLFVPISENDGYLSQNWWDLTESWAWSGTHSWSNTATFTGNIAANATTTVATNLIADGVVRSYTAGQALAAGRAVYLAPTTTRVFYVNDTDATSTVNMIGINLWDVVEDATTYVLTSGVYETSGLTGGSLYYVNSNGQFTAATSTATSIESIIGRAVNTTDLQLSHGRDMQFLLERADTTDVIEVPQLARHATLVISATNSSAAANITGWELNLSKIGKTLATVTHANSTGDSCTATAAWDVTTNAINLSYTGTNCTAVAGTAYFYY